MIELVVVFSCEKNEDEPLTIHHPQNDILSEHLLILVIWISGASHRGKSYYKTSGRKRQGDNVLPLRRIMI